jgi:hypothetical protein
MLKILNGSPGSGIHFGKEGSYRQSSSGPSLIDFVIKGETKDEFLKNGADHAIKKHGMRADDIYLKYIPANLLCHSFNEET